MLWEARMDRTLRVLLPSALAACALLADSRPSEACSPPYCWSASMIPDQDGAAVPANLPAILWRPMVPDIPTVPPDPSIVELVEADDPAATIALTATDLGDGETFLLALDTPLVAGKSYRLVDHSICEETGEGGPDITIQALDVAPLPESLGTLAATSEGVGTLEVSTASGSCSSPLEGDRVRLTLEPTPSSEPWMAALQFETLIDDQPWRARESIGDPGRLGASWVGRGSDLVYLACASEDPTVLTSGLAAGVHHAKLRATLPGTDLVLATESVEFTLDCANEGGGGGSDGGCSTGGGTPATAILVAIAGALRAAARRRSRRCPGSRGSASASRR
jgi:hypothetical protein